MKQRDARCPNRCANGPIRTMPQPNYPLMDMIKYTKRVEEALANAQQPAENASSSSAAAKCGQCGKAATVYCQQCEVDYCAEHAVAVHAMKMFQSHPRVPIHEKSKVIVVRCEKHEGEKMNLYCTHESCQCVCCTVCSHDDHDGHKLISIKKAADGVRQKLEERRKQAAEESRKLAQAMSLIQSEEDVAGVSHAECMEKLDATVDKFIAELNQTRAKEKEKWKKQMEAMSGTSASLQARMTAAQSSLADVSGSAAAASRQPDLALLMTKPSTAEWDAAMKEARVAQQQLGAGAIKVKQSGVRWDFNGEEWETRSKEMRTMLSNATTHGPAVMQMDVRRAPQFGLFASSDVAMSGSVEFEARSRISVIFSSLSTSPEDIFTQWQLFPRSRQPVLIYRGSRDGFSPEDFYRCCAGKRPFLLLLKVAGNDYVFGAYSAVAIPQGSAGVEDSTLSSFLFSLTNRQGNRPFKLNIQPSARAVARPSGFSRSWLGFGQLCFPSLALFHDLRNLNEPDGAYAAIGNGRATGYEIEKRYRNIGVDAKMLFGAENFGCSEVEVFEMRLSMFRPSHTSPLPWPCRASGTLLQLSSCNLVRLPTPYRLCTHVPGLNLISYAIV